MIVRGPTQNTREAMTNPSANRPSAGAGGRPDRGPSKDGGDVDDGPDGQVHGQPSRRNAAAASNRTLKSSSAAASAISPRLVPTPMSAIARTARHRIQASSSPR